MEKCKFCQEELEEGSTVCPHCGKDNAPADPLGTIAEEQPAASQSTPETSAPVESASEETPEDSAPEAPAADDAEQEAPVQIKEGIKATPGKIAIAAVAVVVLIAALAALILSGLKGGKTPAETDPSAQAASAATETQAPATVPPDGNPDDVTCKGTYTVSDEEAAAAKDTVVASMGDVQLTNGQLQVYYWSVVNSILSSNYGYSLMYQGLLDYSQPLDTQLCSEDSNRTWQQFFLDEALNYWQMYQSLALEAHAAGMEMPAEDREYLDGLAASLEETAVSYGLESVEELMLHNVGPGAGVEEFSSFQELYYQGKPYYTAETAKLIPTPEDLDAYFTENEDYYAANGVTREGSFVNVRHILLTPEGGTTDENGQTTYSDAEWADCEKAAQDVLDQWLAGEATEDSFAALANEKSQDPGSNTNGGLYENVYKGQMVEPFENWCFDESRVPGDTGLVKTSYGYHVMYFVSSTPIWEYYARSGWVSQQTDAFIADLAQRHPMEIDYSAIKLGYINLGA
ncbi:MAG: peptidylprolyl isomerase [Firmicutes bacterium]|nr:peptidylprolyl isomerase [Bacillota bacterium]